MSIIRNITYVCDNCGELLEAPTEDFPDASSLARSAGWKWTKERDKWHHYCPECAPSHVRGTR